MRKTSLVIALAIASSLSSWAEESLVQRLVSNDTPTWQAAFKELARLDEQSKQACVPSLIQYVREGPGQIIRERAIGALSRMGSVVVLETIPLLDDADPAVRVAAVRILEGAHTQARDSTVIDDVIVSALKKSLHDAEYTVRLQTVVTLGRLRTKDAMPDLIEALKDNDSRVRHYAATAVGPGVEQAVPILAEELKDKDASVRTIAAITLSTLSDEVSASASAKQAIPQLLQALQDSEVDVRMSAARALARFCGPENQDAIPTLIQALEKAGSSLERVAIAGALEQIGSPEALKAAKPYRRERRQLLRQYRQQNE